ncbi:MAG: tetratricopeptide repeat protein [Myxococcaceae bacterium]
MRIPHATSLSLCLLLLGSACRSSTSPIAERSLSEARALALAPTGGGRPADREILRIQERLGHGPTADDWVLLGQAWVQKARASGDPGLYLAAEGASTAALAMVPGHAGALGLRALVLLNQHQFARAREQARTVLARHPEDLLALATLSDAALEMGDLPAALDSAQRLVDLKPGLAAYGRAAHLRWVTGDVGGAKRLYARAIEAGRGARDPEPVAWMIVQAGLIFWNEGDLDGALAGAHEALTLVPEYGPALVLQGRCLLGAGDDAGARRVLERAYVAQPLVETGWLLADARRHAGDGGGAEQLENRLVRDGRQGDPLMLGLFLASRQRDVAEAVRLLEAEHRARPGIAVEDAYAWALLRAGRLAQARASIDRATAHGTPEPRLLYHAGAIRLAQGEEEAGTALIRRALALNPRFDPVASSEARTLLAGSGREARRP